MNVPNTIKVFYHPLSVVANVQKVAGERYFFMEKPRALFEALQKGGGYHSMEVNLLINLNTFKACSNVYFNTGHTYNFGLQGREN